MLIRFGHHSILFNIGLLMSAVVVLAIVGMLSAVFIAEINSGMAAAVNQSGSLRMQSYRIGMSLTDDQQPLAQRQRHTQALIDEFARRLASPRLQRVIPDYSGNPIHRQYQHITDRWQQQIVPLLQRELVRLGHATPPSPDSSAGGADRYLAAVDTFVHDLDRLVRLLEEAAEQQIALLHNIQAVVLALTIIIVLFTMVLLLHRVIRPLSELLGCADRVRRGDFSGRVHTTGNDELGRLGAAVNLMAEELSARYEALAQRVADKTRDLAHSNRTLELLYRASQRLTTEPLSEPLLQRLLTDLQQQVDSGHITLCLQPESNQQDGTILASSDPDRRVHRCHQHDCNACRQREPNHPFTLTPQSLPPQQAFPVGDRDHHFGVLLVNLDHQQPLSDWQQRLLTTIAGHIGTALQLRERQQESRRLALHEERGIIARELHDSLAQSLSYLKIQVARLAAALQQSADSTTPTAIVEELRSGLSCAYRQLRELLTTFRLTMDARGLAQALAETVADFERRGSIQIELDNALPRTLLSPNEEIHVLQIIREALANVVHHANASSARVALALHHPTGILITITDNGIGFRPPADPSGHYGLNIMRERSASLNGQLQIEAHAEGGTGVTLRFLPRTLQSANHSITSP